MPSQPTPPHTTNALERLAAAILARIRRTEPDNDDRDGEDRDREAGDDAADSQQKPDPSWAWTRPTIAIALLIAMVGLPASAGDGDLDASFSDAGVFRLDLGDDEQVADLWTDADGRILVAGTSGTGAFILALRSDGTPDTDFTEDGSLGIDADDLAVDAITGSAVARSSDGRVLIAGIVSEESMGGTTESVWVNRRQVDGLDDTTFGSLGHGFVDIGSDETVSAMLLSSDGSITIVGTARIPLVKDSEPSGFAFRLTADGTLDTTFGDAGIVLFDSIGAGTRTPAALDDHGHVLIATTILTGTSASALQVVRLRPDGSVDDAFASSPVELAGLENARSVTVAQNGRVVVSGVESDALAQALTFIIRLEPDGGLDHSLRGRGWANLLPGEEATATVVESSGRTLLALNERFGVTARLGRLLSNGLLDESLDTQIALTDANAVDMDTSINNTVVTAGTYAGMTSNDLFATRHQFDIPDVTFADDDGSTFEDDIEAIANAGITLGCDTHGNYCPSELVTRGQMAAFLVRGIGYTDDGGGDLFDDDNGSIFERDIDKLATAAVTLGCDTNHFCPADPVTRGQMAAFLVRALGYEDGVGDDRFSDDDGSIFERDIDKLAAAGVTLGCDTNHFCPTDPVTRGQMAAFLARALGLGD